MKNRLLPLFMLVGGFASYGQQVIIGDTKVEYKSALVHMKSDNKGILIPQVKLTSSTDTSTITDGNVNSLLVFNTATNSDITPGYYYWYVNKWCKIASLADINNNAVKGEGEPGAKGEPGYPGENVTFYTNTTTGTVYVQNADGTWTPINGKNGLDGKNGIIGGNGLPGAKGLDATIEMYVDYTTGIVYVRDPKNHDNWVPINGTDGNNGIVGGKGDPGDPGVSIPSNTTIWINTDTGTVFILTPGTDSTDPKNWVPINGKDGNNGSDGIVGGKGDPGDPGISIPSYATIFVNTDSGVVYILKPGTDPDDKNNWVPINGKDGNNGNNGIMGGKGDPGDAGVTIPSNTTIWVNTDTGTVFVLTPNTDPADPKNWVPLNGKDGNNGADGIIGGKGNPGDPGISIPSYATIFVNTDTGTVYILKPGTDPDNPDNWVKINGNDGIPGVSGAPGTAGSITTLDAIIKDPNGNIYAYVGDDKTVAGRDAEWASKSPNWVKINGLDGSDGIAGGAGVPGIDGVTAPEKATVWIDNTTGYVYVKDPATGKWVKVSGNDGIPGVSGAPGTAGSITTLDAIIKDPNGNIYAYVGDDKTVAGRDAEWASKSTNWVKINGLDGSDGIAGGAGVPGIDGVTAPEKATVWIDNTTGYVYIKDPATGKWVKVSGNDGIPGVSGAPGTAGSITTLDAIVKDPNGNIYAYVGDDKTVAGRDAEWASKSPNWVKINGLNGTDGIAGATGAPGTAGSITTLDAIIKDPNGNIYAYVGDDKTVAGRDAEWASKSPNWVKINGLDGSDGIAGGAGVPGIDGVTAPEKATVWIDNTTGYVYVKDPATGKWVKVSGNDGIPGVSGAPGTAGSITTLDAIIKDPNGNIYAYVGDDKTVAGRDAEWASKSTNWVKINGLDGSDGIAGGAGVPGIDGVTAPEKATVWIDNTTGYVYIKDPATGKWVKVSGNDGIPGVSGAPGTAGSITTLDAIVKDPNGNIYAYVGDDKTVAGRDAEWASKSPNWVKINGRDGVDGVNGVPGGAGTPGIDGTTPDSNIWINTTTKEVFAYVGPGPKYPYEGNEKNWISINGINGIDGKNGIAGGKGLPGNAGLDGTIEMYVDYETGTVYVRDPKDKNKWISITSTVSETLTVLKYDVLTNKLTYTDELGGITTINLKDLVSKNETLTVLAYDSITNKLTYTDELGGIATINLKDLVSKNETLTVLAYDSITNKLTYKDELGGVATINLKDLVSKNETLTVLAYDSITNKLTYKDELGGIATINLKDLVSKNETLTVLAYDSITNKLTYKDELGGVATINLKDLVSKNETLTVLAYDSVTNKLTYTDEKSNPKEIFLSGGAPQEVITEVNATAGQTSFTLDYTPAATSKVDMYINGVRINKNAYTLSAAAVTYLPANNGSFILEANDTIMFKYSK